MSSEVEYRCFVGGLAWDTADQDLERTFSLFGEVIDSKIINDKSIRIRIQEEVVAVEEAVVVVVVRTEAVVVDMVEVVVKKDAVDMKDAAVVMDLVVAEANTVVVEDVM
ncbi:hypothetical protein Bca4012_067245 [Brassica carinata]